MRIFAGSFASSFEVLIPIVASCQRYLVGNDVIGNDVVSNDITLATKNVSKS